MKKIQHACLLLFAIGFLFEIAEIELLLAAEESSVAQNRLASAGRQSASQKRSAFQPSEQPGRMILVSAAAGAAPAAETQTVFRPALSPEPAPKDDSAKRVRAKIFPYYDKLPRGEKCPVAIELTVQDGWHINANPSNPDFLIPTKVKLKTKRQLEIELTKIKYPKHKLHLMQQETEPYHVYDGKVMIYCLLEIDAHERSDQANLEFHVRYQACNDEQCEKPVTVVMKGTLPLANPGDDIKKIHQDKFPKPTKERSAVPGVE